MTLKAIFDIALDCDIPLPELPDARTPHKVIKITQGLPARLKVNKLEWFHHWLEPDEQISISCAKFNNDYVLRFPDIADFVISPTKNSILYSPCLNASPETLRHMLLDQVIPRTLGHLGELIIHASAVSLKGKSIAFIGNSGQGKSTLAASFHQQGAELLTDDCLQLSEHNGQILGIPNYYGVRLFKDSNDAIFSNKLETIPVSQGSSKNRLLLTDMLNHTQTSPQEISALFFLTDHKVNKVSVNPVRSAQELISLINQTFILDVENKPLIINQFHKIQSLLNTQIQLYELNYPRNFSDLSSVYSALGSLL